MSAALALLGIDFARATLDLREELSFDAGQSRAFYAMLAGRIKGELLVVSTCNRTEFLLASPAPDDDVQTVLAALRELRPTARALSQDCHRYQFRGGEVVPHLIAVAAGLRSQVPGDAHIRGQIRRACQIAAECGAAGRGLRAVIEAILRAGGRVRLQSGIGEGPASVGAAVAGAVRRRIGGIGSLRLLIIGAGEAATDAAIQLAKHRFAWTGVAARNPERAARLAALCKGEPVGWESLEGEVAAADVIVTAVGAPVPLLGVTALAASRSGRPDARPLLIADLGVPRNVEAGSGGLPGVCLLNIDEIQTELARSRAARAARCSEAEALVEVERRRYEHRQHRAQLDPMIHGLYEQANRLRRLTLSGRRRRDAEEVSRLLMKRLLDGPVRRLRRLAEVDQSAALAAAWVLAAGGLVAGRPFPGLAEVSASGMPAEKGRH